MLAAKNLERLIEIEADLKQQYEGQLSAKDAEIAKGQKEIEELKAAIEKQKSTLKIQAEQITELKSPQSDTKRIEQLNRELNSRVNKLQDELESQ